jgi:hypothetical protein
MNPLLPLMSIRGLSLVFVIFVSIISFNQLKTATCKIVDQIAGSRFQEATVTRKNVLLKPLQQILQVVSLYCSGAFVGFSHQLYGGSG